VPDRRAAGGGAGPMSRGLVRRGGGRFRLACGILGFPAACGTLCAGAGARDSRWAWLWLERGPASRPGGREAVDGFACRVRGWASGFPRWSSRGCGRRAVGPRRRAAGGSAGPSPVGHRSSFRHLARGADRGTSDRSFEGRRPCRAEGRRAAVSGGGAAGGGVGPRPRNWCVAGPDVFGLERNSSLSRGVGDSLCWGWCAGLPLGVALALKEGRPHALVGERPARVRLPGQRMGIGASAFVVSGL
jgi:hypothetical protein